MSSLLAKKNSSVQHRLGLDRYSRLRTGPCYRATSTERSQALPCFFTISVSLLRADGSGISKIDRPDVACVALLGYNRLLMPNQLSRIQEELEKTVKDLKAASDSDERKTLLRKLRRLLDEADHLAAESSDGA